MNQILVTEDNSNYDELKKIKKRTHSFFILIYILFAIILIYLIVFFIKNYISNIETLNAIFAASSDVNLDDDIVADDADKEIEMFDYSQEVEHYIKSVPFISQRKLKYPMGCEAVSATMVAQFEGFNVEAKEIIDNTPTDELGKRKKGNVWIGADPFKVFVGHPSKTRGQGSYGCFADPIITALRACQIPCTNISGCSLDILYSYIDHNKPVVVWCTAKDYNLKDGVTWQFPDGSGSFKELVYEHCAVLIGYDNENIYLNDPYDGAGIKQDKLKFESNWLKLYSQAIIIN